MSHFSAGIVLTGSDGYVHIRIWDKSYFIRPEDMGMLLFVGETIPLLQKNPDPSGNPVASGLVSLNPSGRAVIISVGSVRYMLPRDRFIAVALGEDVSCILFEVPGDVPEPEILTPHKGGAAS
ncbi:MAG: hypothetical protein PHD55_03910 [Methanoregula sp.]|jgi:hypothetical protein|nr:hypothetical protein [Methanoregula sp.]